MFDILVLLLLVLLMKMKAIWDHKKLCHVKTLEDIFKQF